MKHLVIGLVILALLLAASIGAGAMKPGTAVNGSGTSRSCVWPNRRWIRTRRR